jgi:hypothetical protein
MKWNWTTCMLIAAGVLAVAEIIQLLYRAVEALRDIRDILQSVTNYPQTPSEAVDEYNRRHS